METKLTTKLMVSFLAVASIIILVTSMITAATPDEIANIDSIKIDRVSEDGRTISVIAGETINIDMIFDALEDASDVRLRAELKGSKIDVEEKIFVGDLEEGKSYTESLSIEIPYELKDQKSDDISLILRLWNKDYETREDVTLRIQRPSYNVETMSVNTKSNVRAGDTLPIDVVMKNTGYNTLEDLYVTARIPSLEIESTVYFGDLESLDEDDEENLKEDRLFLEIPYDVLSGTYALEVIANNDDFTSEKVKQIEIGNDLEMKMIVDEDKKSARINEKVSYDVVVVNPTDSLKVYNFAIDSQEDLSVQTSESIISIPAGLSKTVRITGMATETGEHEFSVDLLSDETLVGTLALSLEAEKGVSKPIVVLTIVLAIIFLVLLGVLVVLLTKKPKKQEEFGESYY